MIPSVFNDPGWLAFVQRKYGLEARVLTAGTEGTDTAFAKMLVFLSTKGKLRTPKLMPFMPVHYQPTSTTSLVRLQRQWLTLGDQLAEQMEDYGYGGSISVDPVVTDVRPWQWRGMNAEVRYTFVASLPILGSEGSTSVRNKIKKAKRSGYACERTDDLAAVLYCLTATEKRQGFRYDLGADDLEFLAEKMSPGTFRMYLAWDSNRNPASARVSVALKGGTAFNLMSGASDDHFRSGVTQLLLSYSFEDLTAFGAKHIDFEGANIQSVASSKMEWGAELVPLFNLSNGGPRDIARRAVQWIRQQSKTLGE